MATVYILKPSWLIILEQRGLDLAAGGLVVATEHDQIVDDWETAAKIVFAFGASFTVVAAR